MRVVMMLAAMAATGACNRNAAATGNAAAAPQAAPAAAAPAPAVPPVEMVMEPGATPTTTTAAAGTLPADFPGSDVAARGADCVVYLGMAREAGARPAGRDDVIMEQAQDMWRSALRYQAGLDETQVQQLVGSNVNPLADTPTAQRDAAAAWCVDNAPEVDPDN